MDCLNIHSELFKKLSISPPLWWINLKKDEDLYFEIRKENYIDVYYNGANIITKLKYNGTNYSGSIHHKYLIDHKSPYINYSFKDQLSLKTESIDLLSLDSFSPSALKKIKRNIAVHYPANSEKGIQAAFIKQSGCFLDSEFAYTNGEPLRIDLIWIDTVSHLIIPIELKTIGDPRLFNGKISLQLKKYSDFLETNEHDLKDYYIRLFDIKKLLQILPNNLKSISTLHDFSLVKKPLLLLGDCEQPWIKKNADLINEQIRNLSVGAYYFGKPGYDCNLLSCSHKNRYIF